jgi:hypothetical protein
LLPLPHCCAVTTRLVDQVFHPLLGKPSLRIDDLVDRCDAEARATLVLATAFAQRRIAIQTRLDALAAGLQRAPWAEPLISWRDPSRGVTATDLMRALIARHPEQIMEATFARGEIDASFAAAVDQCRALAGATGDDAPARLEIDPTWARRWGSIDDAKSIDRDALLGCLSESCYRQLARFRRDFVDGLVTEQEALSALLDRLAHAGVRCAFIAPLPPAYWDRHRGLAALDELLVRSPGAVIVGAAGSGRHALIEAWGRRLRREGPTVLRRHGFNIDNFHGCGELEWNGERVRS